MPAGIVSKTPNEAELGRLRTVDERPRFSAVTPIPWATASITQEWLIAPVPPTTRTLK